MTDPDDDPPAGAPNARTTNTTESTFEIPSNADDLFGWMLDDDIAAARRAVHNQIEGQYQNQGVQTVAKALTTIEAINAQAKRNQHTKRLNRNSR